MPYKKPEKCVHPDCFHCPYPDCIYGRVVGEEVVDVNMVDGISYEKYLQRMRDRENARNKGLSVS